ncbi:MAG TPA: transporter [Rhizomicrobium sp.]|nr:transporter [Rhizomicrobium sp.]
MRSNSFILPLVALALATPVWAGPPYVTDDPEPTDFQHFEIYAFATGTSARDGRDGEAGIDFNYGAAPDLQLTAVLPLAYETPRDAGTVAGIGNIELAAKYRFLHREDFGWDVSVFPRVFLPSASHLVGDRHASFLLPLWAEKDFAKWSTFGGGGCALNNGDGAKNYCMAGWALTREILPALHVGAEIYHQTADTRGGKASTGLGAGATYDLSINYHLMASYGPGIQNAAETGRSSWYVAMQFTF